MGVRITLGGSVVEAVSYSVQESATPLSSADTSGGVGEIRFDVPHIPNSQMLIGSEVRLADTRKGVTLGSVLSINPARGSALDVVTCVSRLGELNIYNVQAQPYIGTLRGAFLYYAGLAGITTEVFADELIADKPVVFPGWNGELWFYMKQMAAAMECDIALVSGVILLRPVRSRAAVTGSDLDSQISVGGTSLAQYVEVYKYDNRPITDELVYPPGGWTDEVTVISVNAGETVEQVLQLSASVSSVTPPVIQTFVGQFDNDASVYTVVGDDGLPITPSAWAGAGGSLTVSINPDTTSLTVTVRAPQNLPNTSGERIKVYSVALAADASGSRYSTLRILGTGVAFNKEVVRVPTGVTASQTAQEVGATVDNPFLSNWNDVYRAATRIAKSFAGAFMTLSGTVLKVNPPGDSGAVDYPTFDTVQAEVSGLTFDQVDALPEFAGKTFDEVEEYWYDFVRSGFSNQVFGNVAGARVWDKKTNRWFRSRSGDITTAQIGYSADDDVTFDDFQAVYAGLTFDQVTALNAGLSFEKQDLRGLTVA